MNGNEMVPSLTFGVVLIVAVSSLVWFLRRCSNRDAYEGATGIDENAGER